MTALTDLQEADDATLVKHCLAGNEDAWEVLITRYSRLIYSIPLRFGLSRAVADEIFQETSLLILEKLDTIRDVDRLSAWIVTSTRRLCIQHWRRTSKVQLDDIDTFENDLGENDNVDEEIDLMAQRTMIKKALSEIPPRDRDLITALFLEDPPWTYDEISEKLGIPTGSIGPTRKRSIKKLIAAVQQLQL